MDPDAIALFRELSDRSPSEREEYYARHQVAAALRSDVESLLRFDGETAGSLHGHVAAAAERILLGNPRAAAAGRDVSTAGDTTSQDIRSSSSETGEGRFPAGTLLGGRYRIITLLGRGGMGELYRASDLKLNQGVALKFLPEVTARDRRLLARFHTEVRLARQISHPNVCRVYDIGEFNGAPYISMEYIDGEDLATLLRRIGRLPHDKALEIARRLCAGLAAAHDKGVVHRDLKPANIMVDARGQVFITDFGLASTARDLETTEVRIGTPAYMAPEQLLGREVSIRSDIYSLGLVLYEMFSGRRPFDSERTSADTPARIASVAGDIDRAVVRAIERCIDVDPRDRPASALAVAALLPGGDPLAEALAAGVSPSPQRPMDGQSSTPAQRINRYRRAITRVGAVSVVILLLGAIYLPKLRRIQPTPVSLEDLQIVQLTTSGIAERPAISPDGKYVAYIQHDGDDYSLRIRQITTGSNVEIVGTELGVRLPAITVTPDGNFVDFVRWEQNRSRELWRVPFLGGRPKRLIDHVDSTVGWSPDGRHMAFLRDDHGQSELVVADVNGTHLRVLASRRRPGGFYSLYDLKKLNLPPAWSLDGRLIAVFEWTGSEDQVAIFNVATSTARGIPVKGLITGLAWLDTESLVLNMAPEEGAASQLIRLSYPDGRMSRLSNDPNTYAGVSVTADGTSLVTARSETRVGIWVGDAMGSKGTEATSLTLYPTGVSRMIAWAADRLVYATSDSGNLSISRIFPGKGPPEEIVQGGATPATTWDGQSIVFRNLKTEGIWKADTDGGQAVELVSKAYYPFDSIVTRDGHVVFVSNQSGVQAPWIVSLDGGSPREVAHVLAAAGSLDVSPDGQSLVFRSTDGQNDTTMICDLPACRMPRRLPAVGRPNPLRYTPDGNIAFVDSAAPSNIWVLPLDGRPPYQLTHFDDRTIVDFAWSRDGTRLAIARASTTNNIVLFKGLKR